MEGSFLEWFDIQPLEIIYRLYSEGQLFDLIFPKGDLKNVELFADFFEQNASSFSQATQEILQKEGLPPIAEHPSVLKAHCRGTIDKQQGLQIQIKDVRVETT